jgi:hypothetical protein
MSHLTRITIPETISDPAKPINLTSFNRISGASSGATISFIMKATIPLTFTIEAVTALPDGTTVSEVIGSVQAAVSPLSTVVVLTAAADNIYLTADNLSPATWQAAIFYQE